MEEGADQVVVDNGIISLPVATCFEHETGSYGTKEQLIEHHDSDFSIHCAPSLLT